MKCDAGVERLAGLKQLAAEVAREESASVAGGAVKDEHRVSHDAAGVLLRMAEGRVVDAQDGQRGPVGELEVAHLEVALDASGGPLGVEARGEQESDERGSASKHGSPIVSREGMACHSSTLQPSNAASDVRNTNARAVAQATGSRCASAIADCER